jgi:hypothetical protein
MEKTFRGGTDCNAERNRIDHARTRSQGLKGVV